MEKIDVINNVVYAYSINGELLNNIDLDTLQDLDLTYLDGCKMLTFNLTQPIKRVVKFSELNSLQKQAEFVETLYENMTEQQKTDFDNFVLLIESLI